MAEERVQMMINFYNIFFSLFLFLWGTDSSPLRTPMLQQKHAHIICVVVSYRYCCICAWVWDCLSVQLTHVAVVRSDPATPRHPRHPARLSGAIRESRERGGDWRGIFFVWKYLFICTISLVISLWPIWKKFCYYMKKRELVLNITLNIFLCIHIHII